MTDTPSVAPAEQEKQRAASAALHWVQSGMLLGLGSGSTAAYFIAHLGAAVRAGRFQVQAVATSLVSEALARQAGIPLVEPRRGMRLDLTVDGADELDAQLQLIKGGGGALLREKVLATAANSLLILADSTKQVRQLGQFPLPLEVVPFAVPWVLDAVTSLGGHPVVRPDRTQPAQPARTDQGNLLVDCHFGLLPDPAALARELEQIPGLVEHGLFLGLAHAALIGQGEQVLLYRRGQEPQLVELPARP
ncbi:ribose-5-phosphate isomerase RpiA [Hymenobacter sp. HSC-4F20]|uniref:ribose-5-phosphate isomerase RpiA n=1 Tax=Hymenobacter sp. HSC-4F20 TaxID=2864135 RepID=UPI001C7307A1|nr:ribose-5-phosphate isomerase RpiA [Hymenobacter sp. HSC-4F20]MBX0292994.1 ribose-5-phosphate isomerase RpiA [Hymenobacter sp. HSC-4F20]